MLQLWYIGIRLSVAPCTLIVRNNDPFIQCTYVGDKRIHVTVAIPCPRLSTLVEILFGRLPKCHKRATINIILNTGCFLGGENKIGRRNMVTHIDTSRIKSQTSEQYIYS